MNYTLSDYIAAIPIPQNLEGRVMNRDGQRLDIVSPLARINIFVGANNSGKSYLVREFMKSDFDLNYLSEAICREINDSFLKLSKNQFNKKLKEYETEIKLVVKDPMNLVNYNLKIEKIKTMAKEVFKPLTNIDNTNTKSESIDNLVGFIQEPYLIEDNAAISPLGATTSQEMIDILKALNADCKGLIYKNNQKPEAKIYIPEQRTLIRQDNTLYQKAVANYFPNATDSIQRLNEHNTIVIHNGMSTYDEISALRNFKIETLDRFERYEQFLSKYFFESKRVKIIASKEKIGAEEPKKELLIKIGNEPEFPIYFLGTGLQMVILLTLPLFQCESGIICIEEPELCLHPGLQKQLMKVFASDDEDLPSKNFVFFITTHSNHIIDPQFSENNRSVFTVQKSVEDNGYTKFMLTNLAYRQKDALHLLGVTNTSVYLANCTIWVEGFSDRLYLSAFMRAFLDYLKDCKEKNTESELVKEFEPCLLYREGTHYAFVFSAGDNIVHWDFEDKNEWVDYIKAPLVRDLCGRSFVIVDNDNGKNPERKERLKELLGDDHFEELCVSEMENLLPLEAIEAAVKKFRGFTNWKLTSNPVERQALLNKLLDKGKKLGTILEEIFHDERKANTKLPKKIIAEPSGTVTEKKKFCLNAIGDVDSNESNIMYHNMTNESKALVQKVLRFIMKQNKVG